MILFPTWGCSSPLDHPNGMISVGLEAGKPPLVEQECSKLFIGKYKETRNTLEWVEVAWRVPTNTIQWLGGGSMARIWSFEQTKLCDLFLENKEMFEFKCLFFRSLYITFVFCIF
jgi:hypothetical protein